MRLVIGSQTTFRGQWLHDLRAALRFADWIPPSSGETSWARLDFEGDMVAVMSTQWRGLEPSGLGHDLLVEWAPWVREDNAGGHSWHVKPRVDPGYHGDPPQRVDLTDKIVSRIRLEHRPYYSVISRYYLDQLQPWQMVDMLHQTEGWIRSMLLASCGLVELRFNEIGLASARRDRARPYETRSG